MYETIYQNPHMYSKTRLMLRNVQKTYCFHKRPDFTAFPGSGAPEVTLGLQNVQVQVIDVSCRALAPKYTHTNT